MDVDDDELELDEDEDEVVVGPEEQPVAAAVPCEEGLKGGERVGERKV